MSLCDKHNLNYHLYLLMFKSLQLMINLKYKIIILYIPNYYKKYYLKNSLIKILIKCKI